MNMKKSLILLAALALLFPALAGCNEQTTPMGSMNHKFGEDRYPGTSVTLEQFDAHLDYVKTNG